MSAVATLRQLLEAWRANEKECLESARRYESEEKPWFGKQLRAQADGIGRCADDLEEALKEQNLETNQNG